MIKVACCGTFDYRIHEGHLIFLNWAKSLGDHLCVFVVPDWVVMKNKNRIPIYNQNKRYINLLDISIVDNVILMESKSDSGSINKILQYKPDIYAFGIDQMSDWNRKLEKELINIRTQIKRSPNPHIISTTEILYQEGLII